MKGMVQEMEKKQSTLESRNDKSMGNTNLSFQNLMNSLKQQYYELPRMGHKHGGVLIQTINPNFYKKKYNHLNYGKTTKMHTADVFYYDNIMSTLFWAYILCSNNCW